MTRKEASRVLKNMLNGNGGFSDYTDASDALLMAIESLEQESIIDKIRVEIEPKCDRINNLASVYPYTEHREIQELLCEIMDLCEAESEE